MTPTAAPASPPAATLASDATGASIATGAADATPSPAATTAPATVTAGTPDAAPRRRQLRMWRPHLDDLPPIGAPDGYALRTFQPGDERAWGEVMEAEGGIGREWTVEKVRERMVTRPQFEAEGMFFATSHAEAGRPVASATAWQREGYDAGLGNVHMVCALTEHRGRGLGRLVTLAVLHRLKARGFTSADLTTDDFRLSAIKTYLGLGFLPDYTEDPTGFDNHYLRWSAVFSQIFSRR